MASEDQKPVIDAPIKSSMEILSELFESFDAEPPLIIKKEKSDSPSSKKSKKSKKKHKHKDKKHKKKDKKKKRDSSSSDRSELDLAQILIKQEKESSEQKIRIEGTDLSLNLPAIKTEVKKEKKLEDGEVQSDSNEDRKAKKRKHRTDHDDKDRKKRSKLSEERELQHKIDDLRSKIKGGHESRRERRRSHSYDRRSHSRDRRSRERRNGREPSHKDDFWGRDRYRRHRSPSRNSAHIDKKKLLEIARKNAIQMMKSGSLPGALTLGPQAQEKVIAAIKAGGKTIEELTEFCKTLSKQEALGELSSNSEGGGSESDNDKPFHHPFQIKDRPTSITMNIKNSVPLPIKSTQERTSELRLQFPVSSGQLHRKTEGEWVPVSPKKPEVVPKPVEAPVQEAPGPQPDPAAVDIGSIVSQRLTAIRKLQENPNDVQALTQMYKSNKEMQSWAQSKQQPGQFTGTTGAQVLSQAELSSGYQAWAKKDQLVTATPVSGGMGMHLLQKMGWKPGEGLGKEKTGALEPLLLEVKLDKKGLVANEEQKKKKKQGQGSTYTLQNKHPVSLLGEYASKKKLGAPQYDLCFECGPDHKKNFLFKVTLNGVEYKPNVASPNKKEAKAAAASVCLQHLGLIQ
ncbi:Protein SON-like Protein [Tribolium castaneum]|uniref:Protein SON-like Protein n=1 Tax=Tribolium castaneum TaxID=7070 RepID=D7EIU2_TRICA|nr:PREDICTED: protein SON isoform X1 [Tribolium castaneum]EFA12364.2 Protein SON-like Protein [Tribolium castaneum]|eukprot:XP_967550.1 PREDICTED: protein SON isoform X1 [Tribolium castaneum]